MTRLIRARNTEVLPYLEPRILEDPDFTKDNFVQYVGQLLVQDPQHTFVLVCFDDQDELVGFIIAYAPQGMSFTFIYQAWYDAAKVGADVPRLALSRLKNWSDLMGRPRIVAETRRNPEAFLRKWGFREVSKTLELNLYEQEAQDGRWSEDGLDSVGQSEGSGHRDQQVPEGKDRTSGGSVSGAAGSRTDAPVRSDPQGSEPVQRELPDAGSDSSDETGTEREGSGSVGPSDDSEVLRSGSGEAADAGV